MIFEFYFVFNGLVKEEIINNIGVFVYRLLLMRKIINYWYFFWVFVMIINGYLNCNICVNL